LKARGDENAAAAPGRGADLECDQHAERRQRDGDHGIEERQRALAEYRKPVASEPRADEEQHDRLHVG
jgi:hypothetical protein